MKAVQDLFRVVFSVSLIVLFATWLYCFNSRDDKRLEAESVVFRNGHGYGYTINYHGRVLLHQPNVPSYDSLTVFCDSMEAVRISNVVINRIRWEEQVPLSRSEIKKYGVALCNK